MRSDFIDTALLSEIFRINFGNALIMFGVALLLFYFLPRWLFPQRYAGVGMERVVSNIMYMLVYVELFVPLFVYLKIFNLLFFLAFLLMTKLFFYKFVEKKNIQKLFRASLDRTLIAIFTFFDDVWENLVAFRAKVYSRFIEKMKRVSFLRFVQRAVTVVVFLYLFYILGYRCFISMANPLPDTSQFFEWVANLKNNTLWADNKTAGADFYGISVFIFFIHTFTNIDTIVLFNIYPLLLIFFLLFGTYFVLRKFTHSWFASVTTLLIYAAIFIASPWNEVIATYIATTDHPDIVRLLGLQLYDIPNDPYLFTEGVGMYPYIRYFSGMAYEFASAFFLINLYYLIRTLSTARMRYLINYTLSLILVFIFHGGGAIVLMAPSVLIALHAFISAKLNKKLLIQGVKAIILAAILGNGWMFAVLKYGIPQDFGVAAPFLDRLFGTKQAMEEIAATGAEFVVISKLSLIHLYILVVSIVLFLVCRVRRNGFFYASFLLIPLGVLFVYFAQNLGFTQLVHPYRAVEYLMLSLTLVLAALIVIFEKILHFYFAGIFDFFSWFLILFLLAFVAIFVPKYYETDSFQKYINYTQYSDIPFYLYKIVKEFRPFTWTVVSYIQEYSKVLGKGYMININDFVRYYSPYAVTLEIPTRYIFLFVEDIPHQYRGSSDWFYRWREDIQAKMKAWVAIYSATHKNIKIFGKTKLLTVYMIDNSAYLQQLERKNGVQ